MKEMKNQCRLKAILDMELPNPKSHAALTVPYTGAATLARAHLACRLAEMHFVSETTAKLR